MNQFKPFEPEDALALVHKFLREPYWPAGIVFGEAFTIIADDLNDDDEQVRFSAIPIDNETIRFETTERIPNQEPTCNEDLYRDQPYRVTIERATRPLVFGAAITLALAFQLDSSWEDYQSDWSDAKIERLLDHLPWLRTLETKQYKIQGDDSPWPTDENACSFGLTITPYNDTWPFIGHASCRIRHGFGGGHNPHVYSALYILAEAIRLEETGSL